MQSRIFACQNPLQQGGGRKGLPKSFVNRFTQVGGWVAMYVSSNRRKYRPMLGPPSSLADSADPASMAALSAANKTLQESYKRLKARQVLLADHVPSVQLYLILMSLKIVF